MVIWVGFIVYEYFMRTNEANSPIAVCRTFGRLISSRMPSTRLSVVCLALCR